MPISIKRILSMPPIKGRLIATTIIVIPMRRDKAVEPMVSLPFPSRVPPMYLPMIIFER